MSFSRNNENFLRFEFYIALKGLTGSDKELKYVGQIQKEARRRIRVYYEIVRYDVAKKTAMYQELLEIFAAVERKWLLYSIYLDPHSEQISVKIGGSAIQYLELTNDPFRAYFEQKVAQHDQSFTKGFLKQYFTATLDLSPGEWEAEDGKNNPVTNKLITWLTEQISQGASTKDLEQFFLNYTKLWNIYFTRIYNIHKALILIHKFFESYRKLDPTKINVNFYAILSYLNTFIGDLLPKVFNSPLTDVRQPSDVLTDGSYRSQSSTKAYLIKIGEFQDRLKIDAVFFQDLSKVGWPSLMTLACVTPLPGKKAYFLEAAKRKDAGNPPNFSAVKEFLQSALEHDIDISTYTQILSDNYIFFG
jgi:hypothetical protein